jgi:hypothetical protein
VNNFVLSAFLAVFALFCVFFIANLEEIKAELRVLCWRVLDKIGKRKEAERILGFKE